MTVTDTYLNNNKTIKNTNTNNMRMSYVMTIKYTQYIIQSKDPDGIVMVCRQKESTKTSDLQTLVPQSSRYEEDFRHLVRRNEKGSKTTNDR